VILLYFSPLLPAIQAATVHELCRYRWELGYCAQPSVA
jgi:hypothetical protein